MLVQPSPVNEATRLSVLRDYAILDTPADQRFDNITRLAQLLTTAPIAAISLIDEDRLWLKSKLGLACSEVPRSIAFCNYTIGLQGPFIVCDASTDNRFQDNPLVVGHPNVRFYAGMPLMTKETAVLGALFVFDTKPRAALLPHEFEGLYALSRIVVDEIELLSLATHDGLTNVLTSGAIRQAAERQMEHERRAFSVIAIDIDHFKSVNDTYGHAVGDAVLRAVASVLRSESRSSDIIGRIGGEEFVVILPKSDANEAMQHAERLRVQMAACSIAATGGPLRVTASLGVSQCLAQDNSFEDVLARADKALYASKKSGRNRVTHFDAIMDPRLARPAA